MRLLNFQYVCSSVEETKDLLCCSGGLTRSVACEVLETFLNSFPYAGAVATWLLLDIHHCLDKMGEAEIMSLGFDNIKIRSLLAQKKNQETISSNFQQLNGECESKDRMTTDMLEKGLMEYGCPHYRRRCRIRAPCCNEVFTCRHCHNEAINDINVDQKLRHDMPRHEVRQVICSLCGTEQEAQQVCRNCGVCMGKYYCETCKLFDDDQISKRQYHCDGCGICRIGGRGNFFHCDKCGCCYSIHLRNSHPCVEGAMHHDCPVCFEYLFESRQDVTVLPCGHTIHQGCLKEMQEHYQYACPLCSKSVCDMSKVWEKFDMEIAATPMPGPYQGKMVRILCNDCGRTSQVQFHIVAQKCTHCKSYNTRQTRS
ncbi:unnamed protein product [Linum tenue]|uniref:Uncharacterized protein n=1 Tax=Linum tenue TaxID=586396 RepID=A0AAV0ME53_9ROSI|nr:unnamed protein product [Linum tenue]